MPGPDILCRSTMKGPRVSRTAVEDPARLSLRVRLLGHDVPGHASCRRRHPPVPDGRSSLRSRRRNSVRRRTTAWRRRSHQTQLEGRFRCGRLSAAGWKRECRVGGAEGQLRAGRAAHRGHADLDGQSRVASGRVTPTPQRDRRSAAGRPRCGSAGASSGW